MVLDFRGVMSVRDLEIWYQGSIKIFIWQFFGHRVLKLRRSIYLPRVVEGRDSRRFVEKLGI
jgi:hypothetical protein